MPRSGSKPGFPKSKVGAASFGHWTLNFGATGRTLPTGCVSAFWYEHGAGDKIKAGEAVTKIRCLLYASCFILLASVGSQARAKSIYERLGGQPASEVVVKDFAGRVLAEARINKKFAKSDPARLIKNLTDFVCKATGGPCTYTGRDMKTADRKMGTTAGEFKALVEDLVATLDKFKVPAKEKGELLAALGPLKGDIVEKNTMATGEPLPKAFKPAPPLNKGKATKGQGKKG